MAVPKIALAPDYEVSRLIVGGWQVSEGHSRRRPNRRELFEALGQLVDAGHTTFDCADIYTGVEQLLGEFRTWYGKTRGADAAAGIRMHTKFVPDLAVLRSITKKYVERVIDRSLRRLAVERLDLVQFAWWDYRVPGWRDAAQWLSDLQRDGKINCLGITNFDVERLREMIAMGLRPVAHQVQYSLLDRRPAHRMAEFCAKHDIKLLCYGTLAGGFLSARYLDAPEPPSPLENRSLTKYRLIIEEFGGWKDLQSLLRAIAEMANIHGVGLSAVAVRYVLEQPQVAAAIVGVRNASHVEHNLEIARLKLSPEEVAQADRLVTGKGPTGDVFGLERQRDGPHGRIMRYDLNRIGDR